MSVRSTTSCKPIEAGMAAIRSVLAKLMSFGTTTDLIAQNAYDLWVKTSE